MKPRNPNKRKNQLTKLRAKRVRSRVRGSAERPRLTVKRSLKHLYAQVIDDVLGKTLVMVSDLEIKEKKGKLEMAKDEGRILAEKAKAKGINSVIFDRGAYRYHGVIAALAEGAREGGLNF